MLFIILSTGLTFLLIFKVSFGTAVLSYAGAMLIWNGALNITFTLRFFSVPTGLYQLLGQTIICGAGFGLLYWSDVDFWIGLEALTVTPISYSLFGAISGILSGIANNPSPDEIDEEWDILDWNPDDPVNRDRALKSVLSARRSSDADSP